MPKLDRRQLLLAEQRRNVRQRQILQIGHVFHRHDGEIGGRVRKGKGVWPNQCAGRGVICTHCQGGKRSEEHTSELQSLMRISYAVFCLKKKKAKNKNR